MSIITLKLEARQILNSLNEIKTTKNIECVVFKALKLRHKEIKKLDAMPYIKEIVGV